jgi:Leucine-rich repeat (LRR) protein
MSNLTELFLDSNNINKLDKGVFDGLKSLQKLSLANNCIDKLDMFGKYGNSGLESLNYLNINNNKISTIESNTFKSK